MAWNYKAARIINGEMCGLIDKVISFINGILEALMYKTVRTGNGVELQGGEDYKWGNSWPDK